MPGRMPYERFEAWKVSHELALAIDAATRPWPRSELYALTSQLRRAALSGPTNIAEGFANGFTRVAARTERGTRRSARRLDGLPSRARARWRAGSPSRQREGCRTCSPRSPRRHIHPVDG